MADKKRVSRFLLSGGSAALTEFIVFIVMTRLMDQSLLVSQSSSFLLGFVVSFILNKIWVFKSGGRIFSELPAYALLAGVNLVISNVAIAALAQWGLQIYIAKILLMALIAAWNYVLFQKLIFTSSRRKE